MLKRQLNPEQTNKNTARELYCHFDKKYRDYNIGHSNKCAHNKSILPLDLVE